MYIGQDNRGYLEKYPMGLYVVMYTNERIFNVIWS